MELDLHTTGATLNTDLGAAATSTKPAVVVEPGITDLAAAVATIPFGTLLGVGPNDQLEVHISASKEGKWAVVRVAAVQTP